MKRLIALAAILATSAIADPVPLSLQATGYTELIMPQSVSYQAAVPESVTEDAEGNAVTNAATEAAITIIASYQLRSGVPVVETTLSGITTVITPNSNPTFNLTIKLPVETFSAYFGAGADGIVAALQAAGDLKPNDALTALIRQVAAQVIAAGE